ncbi:hypothetical protein ACERII_14735 [Evansella sp. AB-rgal1]|uniref:hypothetical protein n=1 Tax=Evansella sp. AB-rgal1 TaxID=3242696 RepID=UPI00359DDC96
MKNKDDDVEMKWSKKDREKAELTDYVTTGGFFSLIYHLGEMLSEPKNNIVSWIITLVLAIIITTCIIIFT